MTFRDDRLFLIATDDTHAPKQYFDAFRLPRVQVKVIPTEDGTSVAKYVLDRLLGFEHEEGDQRWLVLDIDHMLEGTHRQAFMEALGDARRNSIGIALSRPCFELWLLLHHVNDLQEIATIPNAQAAADRLAQILGGYNKSSIDLTRFPPESIAQACTVAREIDPNTGDIMDTNGSRVYLLLQQLLSFVPRLSLPAEYQHLVEDGEG